MFDKIVAFLFAMGLNGIAAIFMAVACYLVLAVGFIFAMIPVVIIFGREMAQTISTAIADWPVYTVIYVAVFLTMMAEDYKLSRPSLYIKRWLGKRRASV